MSFMAVAVATGVAAVILGLGWMLAGRLMLKRWGIQASPDGVLLGQRLGAVYLGIALMLFVGRSAPPSEFRDAFSWGMVLALGLLAAHGVLCMARGRVGKAMLVTVVVEVVLAAGFLVVLLGRAV